MNEIEKRLKCEDRGPVDPFNEDGMRWVVSCARCMHTAHVVILLTGGERKYACPRCLVFLDGSITTSPMKPSVSMEVNHHKSWEDFRERAKRKTHPAVKNRIARYL